MREDIYMKQFFTFFFILLIFGGAAYTQSIPKQSKDEQQLRNIEEKRREAIKQGDLKTLGEIYADDFTAIAGNGSVIDREQLFAVFKRNDPSVVFTTDEISVRVFGKTAIFSGRLTGRTVAGETVSAGRFTHFFVRRKGRWVCVHGQSTPLPR
jgi:ketosteroid isomerase-like protein